jgi:hypothetical protein
MKFKENRDRTGTLRGYFDEEGISHHLSSVYKKDVNGNPTEELKDDVEIIPMTDAEVQEVKVKVAQMEAREASIQYQKDRVKEYPPIEQYIDGIVKGDATQIQSYIDACLAVKAKYPKP